MDVIIKEDVKQFRNVVGFDLAKFEIGSPWLRQKKSPLDNIGGVNPMSGELVTVPH